MIGVAIFATLINAQEGIGFIKGMDTALVISVFLLFGVYIYKLK